MGGVWSPFGRRWCLDTASKQVYSAAKQVAETVFSSSGRSFRKVVLVEYPRRGVWCLALQTADSLGEVQAKTGEEVVVVFVPTTPSPTSRFMVMVPRSEVVESNMSVDDGLKMGISMGIVAPEWPKPVTEKGRVLAATATNP